jgi:hypothetical protein
MENELFSDPISIVTDPADYLQRSVTVYFPIGESQSSEPLAPSGNKDGGGLIPD